MNKLDLEKIEALLDTHDVSELQELKSILEEVLEWTNHEPEYDAEVEDLIKMTNSRIYNLTKKIRTK